MSFQKKGALIFSLPRKTWKKFGKCLRGPIFKITTLISWIYRKSGLHHRDSHDAKRIWRPLAVQLRGYVRGQQLVLSPMHSPLHPLARSKRCTMLFINPFTVCSRNEHSNFVLNFGTNINRSRSLKKYRFLTFQRRFESLNISLSRRCRSH